MPIELTEEQQKAIRAQTDEPSLILAAAGSGKTLVLCHRILHFISQGVAAENILAVTFSRRAGQDLLHRLHSLAPSLSDEYSHASLDGIHVSTFHSFCLRILRAFPTQAGLSPDFLIITPKMQLYILEDLLGGWYEETHSKVDKRCLQDSCSITSKPVAGAHGRQNIHAEALRLHQQLQKFESTKKSGLCAGSKNISLYGHDKLFMWIYGKYKSAVKSMNGIDFNDFPRLACKVLENSESAFSAIVAQAQYILVDEFQDTDVDQFQLLRLICRDHKRLTVIGDDDQQIYSWRGAAGFLNLAMFGKFFCRATVNKLEQNFRSSGAIVAAARSIIAKNVNRTTKTIRTLSPTGTPLSVCEARNEQCEASAVANFIVSLKKQNIPLQEIAVLYRLQHVGLELRNMLLARGIPCSSRSSLHAYGDSFQGLPKAQQSMNALGTILHDVLAALRLMLSESDDLSCKQVMEALCPNLCFSSVFKFAKLLQHDGTPLYKALLLARSHLLGLKKHESLPSCRIQRTEKTDEDAMEGLHLISQILEKAVADLRYTGMKNVIINLVQQLSPFRTRKDGMRKLHGISVCESVSQQLKGSNLEFAGIKALLQEASKFDMKWKKGKLNREICPKGVKSRGYKTVVQQKTSRQTLQESYKLESKNCSGKIVSDESKRLQSFIDYISLKLHDGELGDCGDACLPLKTSTEDTGEPEAMDGVVLSTIHQAKGLEWTAVILVRANEGIIPLMDAESSPQKAIPRALTSGLCMKSDKLGIASGKSNSGTNTQNTASILDRHSPEGAIMVVRDTSTLNVEDKWISSVCESIEEERRLMYVALTRAKRFLLVTYVMLQGQQVMLPSRFLGEIPKGLIRRTTCYDSKRDINEDASRPYIGRQSDPDKSCTSIEEVLFSDNLPWSSSEKCGSLSNAARSKRTKYSNKKISREAIDVAQSLKDIDDILDSKNENYSISEKAMERDMKIEASKGLKRNRRRAYRIVDSSDDSDFETPNRLLCK